MWPGLNLEVEEGGVGGGGIRSQLLCLKSLVIYIAPSPLLDEFSNFNLMRILALHRCGITSSWNCIIMTLHHHIIHYPAINIVMSYIIILALHHHGITSSCIISSSWHCIIFIALHHHYAIHHPGITSS